MEINQVTLFKLMIFVFCVVLITIFMFKITAFDASSEHRCTTLITKGLGSVIAESCPEGYYENYGKFYDVKKGYKCCVNYG